MLGSEVLATEALSICSEQKDDDGQHLVNEDVLSITAGRTSTSDLRMMSASPKQRVSKGERRSWTKAGGYCLAERSVSRSQSSLRTGLALTEADYIRQVTRCSLR